MLDYPKQEEITSGKIIVFKNFEDKTYRIKEVKSNKVLDVITFENCIDKNKLNEIDRLNIYKIRVKKEISTNR